MPFLPSPLQLMENEFPSVHFSLWCTERSHRVLNPGMEAVQVFVYWEETSRSKGRCELLQHPDFVLPDIRPLLPQDLLHSLSVNTIHVCNHSLTQTSIFANNFTYFLINLLYLLLRSIENSQSISIGPYSWPTSSLRSMFSPL